MVKTPVYFLSHGGPNIMYDHDHPAYKKLQEIGREITQKVKPRAVVVVSGHWQAGRDTVQVNTAEMTELIYEYVQRHKESPPAEAIVNHSVSFYGFPSHYYAEKYPHVGSRDLSQRVLSYLNEAGIKAEGVKRGLDHGVWASFKCAFEPDSNPLGVPIVQVSLFDSEDAADHMRLGAAFSRLREDNVLVIGSGMAVHNLRDLRFMSSDPRPLPYTVSFDAALKTAVVDTAPAQREKAMVELLRRKDARQAHPSFDHLLPLHVAAGAAGQDKARRLFTFNEGSLGWAMFRFGDLSTEVPKEK
jgi:aromatic ring-opening dioxygenase catalytic subunit (LigB family)